MRSSRRFGLLTLATILMAGALGGVWLLLGSKRSHTSWLPPQTPWAQPRLFSVPELKPQPIRIERPPGMAPIAFQAYIRACAAARIHPLRIGQTMGNHPRSVGYHLQDGVVKVGRETIPYCAAVDLGANDLDRARLNRFLRALDRQGFAVWYREGPKWKNGEHIHAVYAFLPMKRQLRGQVLSYLREQRTKNQTPKWARKLRRTKQFRKYF